MTNNQIFKMQILKGLNISDISNSSTPQKKTGDSGRVFEMFEPKKPLKKGSFLHDSLQDSERFTFPKHYGTKVNAEWNIVAAKEQYFIHQHRPTVDGFAKEFDLIKEKILAQMPNAVKDAENPDNKSVIALAPKDVSSRPGSLGSAKNVKKYEMHQEEGDDSVIFGYKD
eukprot:Platyproteum_vivax@DN7045_c0_g1_i1.p2